MKKMKTLVIAAAAVLGLACGSPPPEETLAGKLGDLMEEVPEPPALDLVAPDAAVTLDRNQYVSVMQLTLDPGEQIPKHEAPPSAVYAMTDAVLEKTDGEGEKVLALSDGETAMWQAGSYSLENTGPSAAELVVVTRTSQPLSVAVEMAERTGGELTAAPVETDPAAPAESDYFRLSEVGVEAGEEQRIVCEHPCSVYTLTAASLEVPMYDNSVEVMDVFERRAVWFDWQSEFTVKAEEEPVALVVFEVLQ